MKSKLFFGLIKMVFFLFPIYVISHENVWVIKEEFLSVNKIDFDCHSSSIVETDKGCFCAVWKGGPGKGKSNIDIKRNVGVWYSLFDGYQWSDPEELITNPDSVCWNPVLCKYSSGELLLFYRNGSNPRQAVSFMKKSQDGGKTWSKEEILPAGIMGPTKNKPIITLDGVLIAPSSISVGDPEDLFKATACWIEISEDRGKHWKKIGPLELPHRKFGVIEPALFYDTQGFLRMFCRDRAHKMGEIGYIWQAVSADGGLHWTEFEKTHFPNPDSGLDVVDLGGGKLILIYNHSHMDRFPLHLSFSLDGGNHWSSPIILDNIGEFPAGIVSSDGLVHITYAKMHESSVQRRIKHLVIDPFVLINSLKE